MKTSEKGIDLIAKFEGFRAMPYVDSAGVPTIGYGTTVYPNGRRVTMSDPGTTKEDARRLLRAHAEEDAEFVSEAVMMPLNQNQFDALVSFTYNVGRGSFGRSTLLRRVNENPGNEQIRKEFLRWNKAGGRILRGLTKRRHEEADLYFERKCVKFYA